MSLSKITVLLVMGLISTGCGRSPDSQFYVLNPIPLSSKTIKHYNQLRIGIVSITSPDYTLKPQVIIHCNAHQVKLEEFHRWAESLDKNIQRVIEANLITLLPGAAIATKPWDLLFKPNYQLQLNISQFDVDIDGNSILRADYLIYSANHLKRKGTLYYHLHVPHATIAALVTSMNANLTHLTQDLAKVFASLSKDS
ncbi:PqiC family protein [Legionella fairfieldensis]|uniref:PqiC family protein n=1 Tax=Legionella fairfieldensis TaxID=45064 RepID=UPI000AD9A330|nr:PqiC family protein [Legionella fairfieldensis]